MKFGVVHKKVGTSLWRLSGLFVLATMRTFKAGWLILLCLLIVMASALLGAAAQSIDDPKEKVSYDAAHRAALFGELIPHRNHL